MIALGRNLTRLAVFASGCLACVVWLDVADAGQASRSAPRPPPPKCGCDDKDAMQRDIDDSKWLADAHKKKADELEKAETELYKKMGRSLADGSSEMAALWSSYNSWEGGTGPGTIRTEFATARKYTGSIVVTFDVKTNRPDPAELDRARSRAACFAIAEGISFHEQKHADVRTAGGGQYSRPSQLAREEAAHYEAEAALVQKALDSIICTSLASGPDTGERFAQRERVQRAVTRVAAYADSLS